MSVVVTPLFYLPPIHCFGIYVQSDKVILEAHEHYQKGSFRNKCRIATAQGPLILSIPLRRGKHRSLGIQNVVISHEENWPLQHWRSIQTAYSNTPYFEHYAHLFEAVYQQKIDTLWEWNQAMMSVIQKCLGTAIEFSLTETYDVELGEGSTDLRAIKRPTASINTYPQVHEGIIGFQSDMSIMDLIFHLGPEAGIYLRSLQI